jgi:hypothetical protein
MALILVDGLEDASSWASSFTSFTTGRTGNCLQMTLSQTADFTIISALGTATITVGFAFNAGADLLGGNFLSLRSDAGVTNHVNIAVNSDGSLSALRATTSLGSSAASIIAVNTWYYVEVTATLSDTVGAVVVKVNGTTVINLTGQDTKNAGTKTVFDTVRLTRGSGGANNHRFDDLYIRNDSTTHGDSVVETLYPNGNGNANQWTNDGGNSTSNYTHVNETGVPNISNNVTDSTSGHQDMYTLTDLVRSGTVIGVCHSAYAAKSDSGAIQFKLVNRRSADNKSGAISPTTAYVGYQYVLENDPETSAAWTVANVNALQSGVEVV